MLEPITLMGANISAEIDAYLHHALLGGNYIMNIGNKLKAELVNNNTITLYDGCLCNQGRFMRIKPGMTLNVSIENGQVSRRRIDLIVAHFETSGSTETHTLKVIKGSTTTGIASIPTYKSGDTFTGALINEMPLYAVYLNGLNIEKIEIMAKIFNTLDKAVFLNSGHLQDIENNEIKLSDIPVIIKTGSKVLNFSSTQDSCILFSEADLKSMFNTTSIDYNNLSVNVVNGDANANSVHVIGTTVSNNDIYVITQSFFSGNVRVNYSVIYGG